MVVMMMIKTCMLCECYTLLNTSTYFLSLVATEAKKGSFYLLPMDASQTGILWKIEVEWSPCSSQLFFPYFVIKSWHHQSISLLFWILQHHRSNVKLRHKAISLRMASNFLLAKLLNWQAENQVPSKPALSRQCLHLLDLSVWTY